MNNNFGLYRAVAEGAYVVKPHLYKRGGYWQIATIPYAAFPLRDHMLAVRYCLEHNRMSGPSLTFHSPETEAMGVRYRQWLAKHRGARL